MLLYLQTIKNVDCLTEKLVLIFCKIKCYVGCRDYRHYGDKCDLQCPQNCQERRCDVNTGHCLGCIPGYQGTDCSQSMLL